MVGKTVFGVILAAGKGSRMAPFSARYPKPILPICNKPLLLYQIEYMKRMGIWEIVIVVGHLGYEISRHLGDGEKYGVNIRYFEQKNALGIAHALGQIEDEISGPFLLLLGDTFFIMDETAETPVDVFRKREASAVLVTLEDVPREIIRKSFCVIRGPEGFVKRVIEKPRYAPSSTIGTGIYFFDQNIFDAIRRTPRTAMRDEYEITDSIQILIDDGMRVATTGGVVWGENVSFPQDIIRCNIEQMKFEHKDKVIGKNVSIHPDARILGTSVGDNAAVRSPVTLKNCVIFPGAEVRNNGVLSHSIVTPENIINLSHYFSDGVS